MEAIKLYKDSYKITKASSFQKRAFDYCLAHNEDDVYEMIAFDTETTSLAFNMPSILHVNKTDVLCHTAKIFGISLCFPYKKCLMLVWGRLGTKLYSECVRLLENSKNKVAHRIQYDKRVCLANGIKLSGNLHCTLTQARIHWNTRQKVDLKTLTSAVCPELNDYENELKAIIRNIRSSYTRAGYDRNYSNFSFIPDEVISKYAMVDSFICWLLNLELMPKIKKYHLDVYTRELAVISEVIKTEDRGVKFDIREAKTQIKIFEKRRIVLDKKLIKLAGKDFNANSPKQLLQVLLNDINIPQNLLTKKGKVTTAADVLEKAVNKLENPKALKFMITLLNLRSHNKILGTYLKPLLYRAKFNNGIVYCNFNSADTRTGRMSSNGPNLENIPRPKSGKEGHNPIRKCFICRYGYTNFYFDYSQVEMWLFALQANEKVMLKALINGEDVHSATAIEMLGKAALDKDGNVKPEERQNCKAINFGIIYGMGNNGLAEKLQIPTIEAIGLRRTYLEKFPAIQEFVSKCKHNIAVNGCVKDIFGKTYNIEYMKAHKAVNAVVQGACAQIFKEGILNISKKSMLKKCNTLIYAHDEIIIEVPNILSADFINICRCIVKCMISIPQLIDRGIVLKVDVKKSDKSWEDKEDFKIE